MTMTGEERPEPDPPGIETLLFQCLDLPTADQETALAAACERQPDRADALRRCWQRIRQLRVPALGMPASVAGHRILRRLGGGGMGVVYLAEQERLGRRVAIKLIRSDLVDSPEARERFQREARAASRVEHPGLCPVFEVGEADGVPFLVMPFLEGVPLAARLSELTATRSPGATSTPTNRDLIATIAAVARAAHHAHEHELVHRDIKPGNIMLLTDGRPVLLDFGLARDTSLAADTLTRTSERVGTPAYMAPEQLRGGKETVDRRTDVYALGVVLYEVATLSRAFQGDDLLALREQISSGIRPAHLPRRMPYDLASIILMATAPEVARRYATAAALADDIDRFLRLEPVTARRIGWLGRTQRWARRYPLVAGLLVALCIALGIAGRALGVSLREQRRFQSLALQGESRAAEQTDAVRAVALALAADSEYPTSSSLVQLNRAFAARRELQRWELDSPLRSVGFSSDRTRIQAVTQQGRMYTLDIATRAVAEFAPPQEGLAITFAAAQQVGDTVVFGGSGSQAFRWQAGIGSCIPLAGAHDARVICAAIAADGMVFTGDVRGHVARWAPDGALAAPFPWLSVGAPARELQVCGGVLVVGCDKCLLLAPLDGGAPQRIDVDEPATLLSVAADSGRILAARLGIHGMFDVAGARSTLPGGMLRYFGGHLDRQGKRVAIAHRGSVRIYDLSECDHGVSDLARTPYRDAQVGDGPVGLVRFADDSSLLFAKAEDHVLRVFDGAGEALLSLPGFVKSVRDIAYDKDTQILVTGDDAGMVRLWDVRTCRPMPPEYQVPGGCFNGLATDCSDPLILRRDNGRLVAFPLDGSEPWPIEAGNAILQDARVSRDGSLLALAARSGVASVWDLTTRQCVLTTPANRALPPAGVDFLPGNRLLVVTGANQAESGVPRPCELQVWRIDRNDEQPEARFVCGEDWGRLNHGAATPDGRNIVIGSYDGLAWVIPLSLGSATPTFGEPQRIEVGQRVIHVDVARQGDRFVAVCWDDSARVFSLDGRLLWHLVGHGKRVENAHFSPSGRWVVTVAQDGTARIWDTRDGTSWMEVEVGAPSPVWDAVFSADERVLYTVSLDRIVRGWLLDRTAARAVALGDSPR